MSYMITPKPLLNILAITFDNKMSFGDAVVGLHNLF